MRMNRRMDRQEKDEGDFENTLHDRYVQNKKNCGHAID